MPVVKTIDKSIQEQNAPRIRSNLRANSDTFGVDYSPALKSVGQDAFKAYQEYSKQKKDAQDVRVQGLENQYSSAVRTAVHDPETGLLTRKGENAFGVSSEGNKIFDKLENDLSKNLDEDVKAKFKEKVFATKSSALLQLQGHEKSQYDKYQDTTFQMASNNNIDDAIAGFNDETVVQSTIQKQYKNSLEYATRNGLGEEWVKDNVNSHVSKTHKAVITRMLNGNATMQAKAYYDKYQGQVTGEEKIETEKLLKEGSLKSEAQAITDQLTRNSSGMEDALLKARNIKDPDLRDEATRRIKSSFEEINQAKMFESNQALEQASLFVEQNKTVDSIPANTWSKLDFKDRQTLYKLEAAYKSGKNIETDMQTYNDLMLMANNPKLKTEFLQTSMLKYQDKLAKPELKELIKLQADLRSGKKEASFKTHDYATKRDLINSTLKKVGIDPAKDSGSSGKENQQRLNSFYLKMDSAAKMKEAQLGRVLNNEEFQSVMDDMVLEVVTDKGFFSDTKKLSFEVSIDDVPVEDQEKIKDALKRNNKPINDQNIVNFFIRKQGK